MLDPIDDAALEAWFAKVVMRDAALPGPHEPAETVPYGPHPEQVADLWLPDDPAGAPVVVSIHGGAYSAEFDRTLNRPLARELVRRGFVVWNIEYRRAGSGRLEETTDDAWAALECLLRRPGLRTERIAVFGHSAGGYLSEWVAAHPAVDLVVPLSPATDLPAVIAAGGDDGGIAQWLGARPEDDPALYEAADVRRRLPAATPHVLVHGDHDAVVDVEQSREHADVVRASGDPCELIELAGEGHYAFLDPAEPASAVLFDLLDTWRRCLDASLISATDIGFG